MTRETNIVGDTTLIDSAQAPPCWVLRSMQNGQEFTLHGEMLVGREAECQIPVWSGHISRYHAKIKLTSTGVLIEDLNSTNGTFVNGHRIDMPRMLSMGDEVVFHTERFRLVSGHSGDAEATVIVPASRPVFAANGAPAPTPDPRLAVHQTPIWPSVSDEQPDARVRRSAPPLAALPQEEATRILSGAEIASRADRVRLHASTNRVPGSGPRLVVMNAPLRGKVFPLTSQKLATTWRIGRGESCELRIDEGTVSHDHARLVRSAEGWHIAVSSARNAIVVNGEVETSHALLNGDRLLLGRMEIVFATDVDEIVPVQVAPKSTLLSHPWAIGVGMFALVTTMGLLVVWMLSASH